ncbi:uncharacterized protein [Chelonus insularis]|uniref:uncharacterized protein n=1 Tax=Chelonus insularis TaxID=460826 RepID=UPI00158D9162|nr:uncharacterized protein LOC118073264 [Chelonus insularis]
MKCVLFAGIIASIFIFGEALECYHTHVINKVYPIDQSIECLQQSDQCVKVSSGFINGTSLLFRSCTENALSFIIAISVFVENKTLSYMNLDFCDTDNCNSAQSIYAILSTILTSLFVSIFTSY